jgi:ATP-dependent DNA helicase RecQ
MPDVPLQVDSTMSRLPDVVRGIWGFDQLRPLQEDAIRAGVDCRDALVVMPTGGGKSLCYQVPPLLAERTDVVVSPLIALMKDQVDGLRECGYPAVAIHSGMQSAAQRDAEAEILSGRCRLVLVAPERLLTARFLDLLRRIRVRHVAVDEAHCISHWGHDFRPEYRKLATLRQHFPGLCVHAYTATATPRVREDIIAQLNLRDPLVLIGRFDRPNLSYRIVPRIDLYEQAVDVLKRHAGQAVIVYCISRKDTEAMASWLKSKKVRAAAYHAGMDAGSRRKTQDAFAEEKLDVIVATVAFGMGVDRSDVRCVMHTAMPKSIEHYQQETGRAGRDGLPAECVLLYSSADVMRWEKVLSMPREEDNGVDPAAAAAALEAQLELLGHMRRFCAKVECRHRGLSEYFGQTYETARCGACDVCLGEVEGVEDATVTAQKILSCVARVRERFGVGHVVDVLMGAATQRIQEFGHDQLSTYGLMKEHDKKQLTNLVHQLLDQELLARTHGEYPLLKLNAASWEVMRGKRSVYFTRAAKKVKKSKADVEAWEGVDQDLFESLRALRRQLAQDRGIPAYQVFSDATLRDLAVIRPTRSADLRGIYGIGKRKAEEFGADVLDRIRAHVRTARIVEQKKSASNDAHPISSSQHAANEMFARRQTIEEVMAALTRARSTTLDYLCNYIASHRPGNIDPWVTPELQKTITEAIGAVGPGLIRPVFDHLGGTMPFETIRLVMTHVKARTADET